MRWVVCKKESIYKDMLDINASYKNGSVLKFFNVNQWLSDRNPIVTELIKSNSGLTNDNTNSKKILGFYPFKMGHNARKSVFGGLRKTQAQTSLRICTV